MPAQYVPQLAGSAGVRWVSLDAPTVSTGGSSAEIDISNLQNAFVQAVGADLVWNEAPAYLQGQGMTVAVVDSGDCDGCDDLLDENKVTRTLAAISSRPEQAGWRDQYGHGSLVEGIIGGNGEGSHGKYMGIAPAVNFVSVRTSDRLGKALTSDVIGGLQWVLDNKETYNIRVVNLSLNSASPESYHTNPISAACEILWFNGIVVVVAAGNNGDANLYPPANDPFVITVGATDDNGTASLNDDSMASFSAYGTTESGFAKPELVAPGVDLISFVPQTNNKIWKLHPDHYTGDSASKAYYMHVSGTSFSAPIVSGAAALLLQDEPNLTPDQVKYRLMDTANTTWPSYNPTKAGAGYLDVYAAVHGTTTESANTGIEASQLLWSGDDPITWGSVNWGSVNWGSVNWGSVNWGSVNWGSVNWASDVWD
jgi:serine protease AprX